MLPCFKVKWQITILLLYVRCRTAHLLLVHKVSLSMTAQRRHAGANIVVLYFLFNWFLNCIAKITSLY